MSTDDERPEPPAVPRTRAELRAAREAEERAAEEQTAAERAAAEQAEAEQVAAERAAVERMAAEVAAEQAAVDREAAAEREAAEREAAEREAAEREAAEREAAKSAARIPAIPQAPEPVFAPAGPASPPSTDSDGGGASEPGWTPTTDVPADDEATRPAPWSRRRFLVTIGAVIGVLVLVGTGLGIVSLLQGPRITDVQVDAEQAIESSGSRVILTTNQPLSAIDPEQVTVEPSVPFTVDAAGRGVGVRFTVPLDDDTKYTITVDGVTGAGGGPAADLTTSFRTPASSIFLLRRDPDGDDIIFRTDLSGENAQPVFSHPRINDFRATSSQLVASVEEDDGSRLLVMDRDGTDERELELPGEGYVGAIQVSERGNLVGYSYSDRELSDTEGRASVLVTQSLSGDSKPRIIEVGDKEASVFVWQFVPDSAAVLFIDFDGALSLVDQSTDTGVQSLGLATTIQGISRGTYTAIVERLDGSVVELDLADGSEQPLAASEPDYGAATSITPFPGGTLRHVVARDEGGLPVGQAVIRVDDSGKATPLVEVSSSDSILQACASPSGQYAAVVIAPDMADNPYDGMLLPLPEKLETHLIDMRTGDEIVALTGFDASWCQTAPRF
ncbi:Ig-like domain-containing protein [Microbacterium sp. BLY]|uniref:Ig-like domain-containing protein n=1 Tax=Microbacterium sp. BLY TaxID=2823280 RepID=UPI001FF0CB5D|nr:Ig-like domain-containing protein [Microbacterium sp. BLY]